MALHQRPYNANQLSETLNLNYKTVRHHIKVLEENNVITSTGKNKYGEMYFLTDKMEENYDTFQEIWGELKIN
jgi:predicted ArsR family transcriptional regulator